MILLASGSVLAAAASEARAALVAGSASWADRCMRGGRERGRCDARPCGRAEQQCCEAGLVFCFSLPFPFSDLISFLYLFSNLV
jgi:hypothetical protein